MSPVVDGRWVGPPPPILGTEGEWRVISSRAQREYRERGRKLTEWMLVLEHVEHGNEEGCTSHSLASTVYVVGDLVRGEVRHGMFYRERRAR